MSLVLDKVLKQVEELSFEELLTLQEKLIDQLEVKKSSSEQNSEQPKHFIKIPGAYQPSRAEIEASLARMFTPEELAYIGTTDFSKLQLPGKSTSEMIVEDREDRF